MTFYRAPFFGMPRAVGFDAEEAAGTELLDRLRAADSVEHAAWIETLADSRPETEFLRTVLAHSPFLTRSAAADVGYFRRLIEHGPDALFAEVVQYVKDELSLEADEALLARGLRLARRRVAIAVAFADFTNHWPLERVTHALSDFADAALSAALSHLLRAASVRGEISLRDAYFPEDACGYTVLAMGKYGARELNYSSDIDLIALYEPARVDYHGSRSVQQFFVGLTQKLGRLINDRIGDGYVFRVDWRLRPDPGATPLAISLGSARAYYADRGETWERAAMIKARPAAGDIALGRTFVSELSNFVWPDRMDFWTLREIRLLKKRINEHRGGADVGFMGHNIKIGRGGIREVEFYAQTQQLIYGTTDPYLRCQKTLDALSTLSEAGYVAEGPADELTEAYEFLRQLEHRLQMVNDQQTQTLPADGPGMERVAGFMGFEDTASFREAVLHHLGRVAHHYDALFDLKDGDDASSWNFSDVAPDAETAERLSQAGFQDPAAVYSVLRRWSCADLDGAARDRRAQALSSLVPRVIEAVRKREAREDVIESLDRLIAKLGDDERSVALLATAPKALDLVVLAGARAPVLMRALKADPTRLDFFAEREIWLKPPGMALLMREVVSIARSCDGRDRAERLAELCRRVRMQISVACLGHTVDAAEIGRAMADLFDALTLGLLTVGGLLDDAGGVAIVACGRLGAREIAEADAGELMIVGHGAQIRAESIQAYLASHLGEIEALRLGEAAEHAPLRAPCHTSSDALRSMGADDQAVTRCVEMCVSRALFPPGDWWPGLLNDMVREFKTSREIRTVLARRLATRHAALREEADCADHLYVEPFAAAGGLRDLDLLVRGAHLLVTKLDVGMPAGSTALALDQLVQKEGISPSMANGLRHAYTLLRQIEAYRWATVGSEPLSAAQEGELRMALCVATGAEDPIGLTKSVQIANDAVRTAYAEVVDRLAADPADLL